MDQITPQSWYKHSENPFKLLHSHCPRLPVPWPSPRLIPVKRTPAVDFSSNAHSTLSYNPSSFCFKELRSRFSLHCYPEERCTGRNLFGTLIAPWYGPWMHLWPTPEKHLVNPLLPSPCPMSSSDYGKRDSPFTTIRCNSTL